MQKKDKPFCNKKVSFAIEEEKTVVIIPTVLKQKEKSKE